MCGVRYDTMGKGVGGWKIFKGSRVSFILCAKLKTFFLMNANLSSAIGPRAPGVFICVEFRGRAGTGGRWEGRGCRGIYWWWWVRRASLSGQDGVLFSITSPSVTIRIHSVRNVSTPMGRNPWIPTTELPHTHTQKTMRCNKLEHRINRAETRQISPPSPSIIVVHHHLSVCFPTTCGLTASSDSPSLRRLP